MAEYAGIGTLLQLGTAGSPGSLVTVGQVGDIKWSGLTAGTYDTTTHDNTLSGYKDFITGLKDGGEVTAKVYFDATLTTHKDAAGGLVYMFNNQTSAGYMLRLVLAQYTSPYPTWTSTCVITKIGSFDYPVDGVQSCELTMRVKGKPTLA